MLIYINDSITPVLLPEVEAERITRQLKQVKHSRNLATRNTLAFRHAGGTVNDRRWYHEGIARGTRSIERCVARETVEALNDVAGSFEPVAEAFEHWTTPRDTGGVVFHHYSDGEYVAHC